jgi:alpha-L-rhamnosidase
MKRTVWLTGVALLCAHLVHAELAAPAPAFQSAQPVWPEGKELERNLLVEFRSVFEKPDAAAVTLRLAGASLYRVFVNGTLAAHGPARAGHGFYRVDEWELDGRLQAGTNDVLIEVAGYNANSFYLLDQPSFLQAELVAGGRVLAATGGEGFTVLRRHDRVQRVQRYSFQRPFTEVWLKPGPPAEPVRLAETEPKPLAPRRVPYPDFAVVPPAAHFAEGEVLHLPRSERPWKDRSLTGVGPQLAGFPEGELETIPSLELQRVKNAVVRKAEGGCPFTLGENSFRVLDFGTNLSGFIGLRVKVEEPVRLFVTFDELFGQGDVDFKRLDCVNAVLYELAVGEYTLESFEPYTLRYLKLTAMEGRCTVSEVWLRELANPHAARATFVSADERHNRIFEAARRPSGRMRPMCSWTAPPASARAGCATASSPPGWPRTCAARPRWSGTSSRTSSGPPPSPTCLRACCPCATRPTTTTASSSPTGRCGFWSSSRSTRSAAATAH